MNWLHLLGYSQLTYKYPIRPRKGERIRFWDNDITHVGRDLHALDIIIPDPRNKPLPIWAPQSGIVLDLVQHFTIWGQLNWFDPTYGVLQALPSGFSSDYLGDNFLEWNADCYTNCFVYFPDKDSGVMYYGSWIPDGSGEYFYTPRAVWVANP